MQGVLKKNFIFPRRSLHRMIAFLHNSVFPPLLTEEEENAVIFREIKQAQETIDTTPADRVQTIEEAKLRMKVYGEFAPKLMDEDEIRAVIKEVLAELQIDQPTVKDKGRIMKTLMPRVKGKADGGLVNQVLGSFFA